MSLLGLAPVLHSAAGAAAGSRSHGLEGALGKLPPEEPVADHERVLVPQRGGGAQGDRLGVELGRVGLAEGDEVDLGGRNGFVEDENLFFYF